VPPSFPSHTHALFSADAMIQFHPLLGHGLLHHVCGLFCRSISPEYATSGKVENMAA